jgi:hypothetical protein
MRRPPLHAPHQRKAAWRNGQTINLQSHARTLSNDDHEKAEKLVLACILGLSEKRCMQQTKMIIVHRARQAVVAAIDFHKTNDGLQSVLGAWYLD